MPDCMAARCRVQIYSKYGRAYLFCNLRERSCSDRNVRREGRIYAFVDCAHVTSEMRSSNGIKTSKLLVDAR